MLLTVGIGVLEDGIRARSCDQKPWPESYVSYGYLETHSWWCDTCLPCVQKWVLYEHWCV